MIPLSLIKSTNYIIRSVKKIYALETIFIVCLETNLDLINNVLHKSLHLYRGKSTKHQKLYNTFVLLGPH